MSPQFSATVYRSQGWLCVEIPIDVQELFGTRSRMAVGITLKDRHYRSSIFPTGDGKHFMIINKTMQKECNIHEGDASLIALEKDNAPRIIEIPLDFQIALNQDTLGASVFGALSPSHRREVVQYIDEAKKPETRIQRIQKMIDDMKKKHKPREI